MRIFGIGIGGHPLAFVVILQNLIDAEEEEEKEEAVSSEYIIGVVRVVIMIVGLGEYGERRRLVGMYVCTYIGLYGRL